MKNYQKEIDRLEHQRFLLQVQIQKIKLDLEEEVSEYVKYLNLLYPENHIILTNEYWKTQNHVYPCIRFYFQHDTNWFIPNNKSSFIEFNFDPSGVIKVDLSWLNLFQKKKILTYDYKVRSKIKIVKLLNDWILYGAGKTKKIPQI